jgi:hypothetical protein
MQLENLEERERRAYANGDVETAKLLQVAIDLIEYAWSCVPSCGVKSGEDE